MNAGDILIKYHPHSGKVTRILSPEEFKESLGDYLEPMDQPDDEPWRLFRSREDFEFADLVHDAALNRTQIERLMKFVQHCQDTPGSFTLRSYNDLKCSLEDASEYITLCSILLTNVQTPDPQFTRHKIEREFEGQKKIIRHLVPSSVGLGDGPPH